MTLLCERCYNPIHRPTEPLRFSAHRAPDGPAGRAGWLYSAVHARPCERPDQGDWNPDRRGVSPAAVQWAAEQADDR